MDFLVQFNRLSGVFHTCLALRLLNEVVEFRCDECLKTDFYDLHKMAWYYSDRWETKRHKMKYLVQKRFDSLYVCGLIITLTKYRKSKIYGCRLTDNSKFDFYNDNETYQPFIN